MFHYTYVTWHEETGYFYIGRHSTDNLKDGYHGSGTWVQWAKKVGLPLKTQIHASYTSYEELLEAEQKLLNKVFDSPFCMNINNKSSGFATGDLNPAKNEKERKRRSENSWMKTEKGSIFAKEHNKKIWASNLHREHISKCTKKQWQNEDYRKSKSGKNSHMNKPEHRERMKKENPMFDEENRKKCSDSVKESYRRPEMQGKCLNCGYVGFKWIITRCHNDRCKNKENK